MKTKKIGARKKIFADSASLSRQRMMFWSSRFDYVATKLLFVMTKRNHTRYKGLGISRQR